MKVLMYTKQIMIVVVVTLKKNHFTETKLVTFSTKNDHLTKPDWLM